MGVGRGGAGAPPHDLLFVQRKCAPQNDGQSIPVGCSHCWMGKSNADARKWEVIGAATKSSPETSRTSAGRNLPPEVWWKSIRIRTTSPGRRVKDQFFVDRVVRGICRFELLPPGRAPCGIRFSHVPLEHDLDAFSWRNLRSDLRGTAIRPSPVSAPVNSADFIWLVLPFALSHVFITRPTECVQSRRRANAVLRYSATRRRWQWCGVSSLQSRQAPSRSSREVFSVCRERIRSRNRR